MHVLAAASDRILAGRENARIIFAGDGPSRSAVQAIIDSSKHRARVYFTGALSRQQVAQLLVESDLFVNPGVIDRNGRAEGLGITTIEAMACGLPVVGSRAGGIVETIEDQVTGRLVHPGDAAALAAAVCDLLDDAELRRRMGRAGQNIAREKFTWPILAAQVMRVYEQVTQTRLASEPAKR